MIIIWYYLSVEYIDSTNDKIHISTDFLMGELNNLICIMPYEEAEKDMYIYKLIYIISITLF